MYNSETDLLFPPRAIPSLRDLRGKAWQELVMRVSSVDSDTLDRTALTLMMARLNNCGTCNSDSFRAMQGCISCSRQSLKRFRGSDEELAALFQGAKTEVEMHLKKRSDNA